MTRLRRELTDRLAWTLWNELSLLDRSDMFNARSCSESAPALCSQGSSALSRLSPACTLDMRVHSLRLGISMLAFGWLAQPRHDGGEVESAGGNVVVAPVRPVRLAVFVVLRGHTVLLAGLKPLSRHGFTHAAWAPHFVTVWVRLYQLALERR